MLGALLRRSELREVYQNPPMIAICNSYIPSLLYAALPAAAPVYQYCIVRAILV